MAAERALRSVEDLAAAGLIGASELDAARAVSSRYAIAVTPAMTALINPLDPEDPIARQFVPTSAELLTTGEERQDPIGDTAHTPVKGIVHRYPDRVLVKAVHVCPVYCRFCFRREMVGPQGDGTLSLEELEAATDYIRQTPQVWEVILTGGDPLILAPRRLLQIMLKLADISHVKIIRLHTRVPVVAPDAVNDELIAALKASGKTLFVALHANHPREMTPAAGAACARLVDAGIAMVSQTVLLRGVNDDAEILAELMKSFVENRIKPYYLHHPDLAPGTSHFRLDVSEGQSIVSALRGRISGLCQPTYVLDIPGGHGKAVIAENSIRPDGDHYVVTDFRGQDHHYCDGRDGS